MTVFFFLAAESKHPLSWKTAAAPPPIIHSPGLRCYCRHPLLATLDLKHSPAPRLTIIHNPALSSSCRHRCFSLSYKISKYFLV